MAERLRFPIDTGMVIICSDGHYWPGPAPTAHRALCHFAKKLKPAAVIFNGDAFDGATAGRHPRINWEKRPALVDELHACQERMRELEVAARKSELFWTLGNHDARFETYIANKLPEYELVKGVHLKDHFSPRWRPCWSVVVGPNTRALSPNHIVVKHRYKGGLHASTTNLRDSGTSMATGHTHALEVRAVSDYTGTKFGINTGMLADPQGEQFEYLEDVPRNWRAGFVVCTYSNGKLLWPEIVAVVDKTNVSWRGQLVTV